jgi:hypothetical protein
MVERTLLPASQEGQRETEEERKKQEECAEELVPRLIAKEGMGDKISATGIDLKPNYKVEFRFDVKPGASVPKGGTNRVGRRPGLEINWGRKTGDVDAWGFVGDAASGFMHGFFQVLREKVGFNAEKPCDLLKKI